MAQLLMALKIGQRAVGALHGIRVLDLSRILAGPFCTMILGDYGADVIKIEHPVGGDDTRAWGPPFKGGESAYFMCVNRNKRSVAVNLKTSQGVSLIHKLVAKSDVLVENFLPGKLDAMGLGYSQLSRINPGLVYASISGFGSSGPYAQRPGYDLIASAIGGLMGITGPEDGEPVKVGVAITDLNTGLFMQGAIMAALIARFRTGMGQHLEGSLLEAQVATLANIGSNFLIAGKEARRLGTAHESIVPYQGFRTKDGHIIIAMGNTHQYRLLCSMLNRPDLAMDPRFLDNPSRVKNRRELERILQELFATRTTEEWLQIIDYNQIPVGPINSLKEVYRDPQVVHRQMVQEIDHPTAGQIRLAGIPVKFSDAANSAPSIRLPPPLLGQHTHEVLLEHAGLSEAAIQRLENDKVIACHRPAAAAGESEHGVSIS